MPQVTDLATASYHPAGEVRSGRCSYQYERRTPGVSGGGPPRTKLDIADGGSLEMPRAERGKEWQCRSCAASLSPPSSDRRGSYPAKSGEPPPTAKAPGA